VNTSGTLVSWVSGCQFSTSWKPYQTAFINGILYSISSCSSAISCTLMTSAGTQSAAFTAASYDDAVVAGNTSCHNGAGNPSGVNGQGFGDISMGSTYRGNTSCSNNGQGFYDQFSAMVTHIGDVALDNANGGIFNAGFFCQGCSYNQYIGDEANNSLASSSQMQTYGLRITSGSYYNYVCSPDLWLTEINGVQDLGTSTQLCSADPQQ
jgi:hypothetical protein